MGISSSISCKDVSLVCNSWWVAFGDGLKTKTYFEWDMFFCTLVDEDARHRFITYPVVKAIWVGGYITKLGINNMKYFVTHLSGFLLMMIKLYPCHHVMLCLTTFDIEGCGLIGP